MNEFIDISDFDAKGDGITDDILPLEAALKYAIDNNKSLYIPNGVYRISRQLLIGYKFLNEVDMFNRDFTHAPSYDANAYVNARFGEHLNIIGDNKSVIFGDFEGTDAVVYYGIIGGGNSRNRHIQHNWHSIKNLTIVSKNNYAHGNFIDGQPTNQTGLCIPRTPGLILDACTLYGTQFGLLTQDVYGSNISNIKSVHCTYGSFLIGHNANLMSNISFDNCETGMYLSGAGTIINNIWGNNCPTSLQIAGKTNIAADLGAGNIVINGAYFENDLRENKNVAQLIIGDDIDNNDSEVTGITINGMSGSTGERCFMQVKNAKDISLSGCSLFYEPITTSFAKTKITALNMIRPLKVSGLGTVKYLN